MDSEPLLFIVLFFTLLFLSAFFSGSESAYFSLSVADLRQLKEEQKTQANRVLKLLNRSRRLLTCILIGNTLVNVAAATSAALFLHSLSLPEQYHLLHVIIEIFLVTICILLFSEILPKVVAVKSAPVFAQRTSLPLLVIVTILTPISFVFESLAAWVSRILRIQKEIPFVTEKELKTLIEISEENGTLDSTEREMIHSIFEFGETTVKEVMVPRIDMACVDENIPLEELLQLVKSRGHSRIPVFSESVDQITGILYVKDLLPFMKDIKSLPELKSMVRKPYFVPESKLIDELLKEFKKERIHMAIVVDEYGGTAGLITLEDVIEEIVGEIRDEHDREAPLIKQVDDLIWTVDGKMDIEDFNEILDVDLPSEEGYESLGGFILHQSGSIPMENDEIEYLGMRFVVEKVLRNRIKLLRVILPEVPDIHSDEENHED